MRRTTISGWCCLGVSLGLMVWLVRSRWGLFFRAIRENEDAAAAAGVKVLRFRVLAFAITTSFAGLAGGFFGHYIGILTPDIGSVDQMGLVVAMAVIGGAESLFAATVGALLCEALVEALRSYDQWRLVLFGATAAADHSFRSQWVVGAGVSGTEAAQMARVACAQGRVVMGQS